MLRWTRGHVVLFLALATIPVLLYDVVGFKWLHVPWLPLSVVGTAVAFIVGFKNNASYDRLWEARKIWGGIVNSSRTFGRQVTTLTSLSDKSPDKVADFQKELIYRHIAWINALRMQLRRDMTWEEIEPLLGPEEFKWVMARQNHATQLVQKQGLRIAEGTRDGFITESRYLEVLDETLTSLYDLQGKAERIKNTPLPRQYDYFPRVFLFLFVTLLPSGMITELEKVHSAWMVIPLATVFSYVFYVLMRVGEFNEDPFENRFSDTPMTALCRTIEIDMREQLGETDLPPKIEPDDGILM